MLGLKLSRRIQFLLIFFMLFTMLNVQCTSSDEDTTVLEGELENLDTSDDSFGDEAEGLGEISESDLVDEVDGDDLSIDSNEVAVEGEGALDAEFENAELDDADFADGEFDDAEFSDESFKEEEAFAEGDSDFNEFSEFETDKQFAQNEQTLKQELNKADYPVVADAQPTFPEEVVSTQGAMVAPVPAGSDQPLITSETQDISAIAASEPEIPQEDIGQADPIVPEYDQPSEQSWVPVVKIKTDPFFRNDRLMNAVYLTRPKDDLQRISEKIFSADRVSELKDDNPHLAKGLDPGDKIYYNSPSRPDDRSQVKVYYEDIGLKPQYYRTKEGDNMRRLGSKLLGFPEGWKEIWAINQQVDSKTILPSGLEIKYWTGEEQPIDIPVAVAETNEALPADPNQVGMGGSVDPMGSDPFTGGGGGAAAATEALPEEPPLPDAQIAMPDPSLEPEVIPDIEPFPEPGVESTPPVPVAASAEPPKDSLLSLGALALLVIGLGALVAIQIKKRKDHTGLSPQSLEYTQV